MRRRTLLSVTGAALLGGRAAHGQSATVAKASLAPGGTLRAAINYGNAALAVRTAAGGLDGVSVDIARELARRLAMPLALVPFDAAGKVTAAAGRDVWDVAFLARDPERAREITFTAAYVVIDGNYVVPGTSVIRTMQDVDRPGVSVAVSTGSAYDLFLSRTLTHARLIHAGSTPETIALFLRDHVDVLAGVRRALEQTVSGHPDLRLIPQPFMAINQAMGTPAGRPAGSALLAAFVEAIKADGFVTGALKQHGQDDATVAPPA